MQQRERGGFLRGVPPGDQSSGPRMGQPMPQPGPHIPHGGPPMHHMQPRPPPGRPQGFQNRPHDVGYRKPAASGPHYHPRPGMRPHHHPGQGMRPQGPMGVNWNANNAGGDRGGNSRGPYNSSSNITGSKHALMGSVQQQAPHPLPGAPQNGPRLRATDSDFEDLANVVVPPQDVNAVGYVERVRAMNALAKVGAAARAEHSAAAIKAAARAFRSGTAFKGSAYAEDVSMFVPSSMGSGAAPN